jgi:hypothetical protein
MSYLGNYKGLVNDEEISAPLRTTLAESMKENPDKSARIKSIAYNAGSTVPAVKDIADEVEANTRLKNMKVEEMATRSPATASFLGNYENASQSHDDIEVMEGIEGIVAREKLERETSFMGQAKKLFQGQGQTTANEFASQFDGLNLYLNMMMSESERAGYAFREFAVGVPEEERGALRLKYGPPQLPRMDANRSLQDQIAGRTLENQALRPENMSQLTSDARDGITSFLNMVPAMATGGGVAVLGGKALYGMLGTMGLQVKGSSFASAINEGKSFDEASLYSNLKVILEVGTEAIPLKVLTDIFSGSIKSGATKKALEFLVKEIGSEQVAALGDTLIDNMFDLDEEMANATSASEMLDIQLRRQKTALVATIVSGGLQLGTAKGVSFIAESVASDEKKMNLKVAREQQTIGGLMQSAAESKLRGRSKPAFKQFINGVAGKDVAFHMDAVQASLYLAEVGESSDPAIALVREALDSGESQLTGEIVIPAEEFMAEAADSEHLETLQSISTLSSETLGSANKEKADSVSKLHMETVIAREAERSNFEEQTSEVVQKAKTMLVGTGRHNEKSAEALANLVAAYVGQTTGYADNAGQTMTEVFSGMGLNIEGIVKDETSGAEYVLPEKAFTQKQDLSGVELSQERIMENGERVTIVQNAQQEWDTSHNRRDTVRALIGCIRG